MRADLTSLLLAYAPLTALIGTRLHWGRQPATVTGRPYVNMTGISDPRSYHFEGATNLRQSRIQFDVWAESAGSAFGVAAAIEARLSGYRGMVGNTKFRGIFLIDDRDFIGETTGNEAALWRRSLDFNINWLSED